MVLLWLLASSASAAPVLTVSPNVLPYDGATITLAWSGMTEARVLDHITIVVNSSVIGWRNVSWISTWERGSGKISFPFANLRIQPVVFHYVSENKSLASAELKWKNAYEPTQGHLALTEKTDGSEMRLMWNSNDKTAVHVEWGEASGKYTGSAIAITSTYGWNDLCTAPAKTPTAWLDPGLFHDAVLTGLKPATKYFYRYGGGNLSGWTAERSFMSAPSALGENPTSLAFLFGDMGLTLPFITKEEQQTPAIKTMSLIYKDIQKWKVPAMVLHNGDISYARGYAYLWEWFQFYIEPIATMAPYMVSIGNHEYDWPGQPFKPTWADYNTDSGGECGVPYQKRFHMPGKDTTLGRNLWYSYEFGGVHYTILSTEHDFLPDSEQWKWADQDLANVDRSRTPWVVVASHRPMYTTSARFNLGDQNPFPNERTADTKDIGRRLHQAEESSPPLKGQMDDHFRNSMETLLIKHHVDVALWGHVHIYERTCKIKGNFECADDNEPGYPVHLIAGCAGHVYQDTWASNMPQSPSHTNSYTHVQPEWSRFRTSQYGYTRLWTIRNSTHNTLKVEYVGDADAQVHDSFILERPRTL